MRRALKRAVVSLRSWINTPFFLAIFWLILCFFHVLQLAASLVNRRWQKTVLDWMNLSIVLNIRFIAGARYRVVGRPDSLPTVPIILVSNHQSMYDIPMMMWELRYRELGFIAKKELGRWIPSISLALRTLGSVLIDRKDLTQATAAIAELGERKEREQQLACIFPEGTRARDGEMKRFKVTGFKTLLSKMPNAQILPVVVSGNWKLLRYNFLPVPVDVDISLTFLELIEQRGRSAEELLAEVEGSIRVALQTER